MKNKNGFTLEEVLAAYEESRTKGLPYISCNKLDKLEREKGYSTEYGYRYSGSNRKVDGKRKTFEDAIAYLFQWGKITYFKFYETNATHIRGLIYPVILYKSEDLPDEE